MATVQSKAPAGWGISEAKGSGAKCLGGGLGLWWQLPEAFAGGKLSSTPQWFHERESGGGWAISPLSLVSLGEDGVAPGSKIY